MTRVGQHFRPEFINRIDDSVVFHPLQQNQMRGIAQIQLAGLTARLAEQDITIELTESLLDHLAILGFDPVYGARPLKRVIQKYVENPLANRLLTGEFGGGDHIKADYIQDEIRFDNGA